MSNRKNIAKAAGVVTAASIVVYGVTFLREIAVSARFGVGVDLDVLLVAYALPAFVALTCASVIQAVLLPLYTEIKQDEPERTHEFTDRVFTFFLITLLGLMAILAATAPWLIRLMAHGFTEPKVQLARRLIWVLLPVIPCIGLSGMISGLLYAERNFWGAGMLPAVAALAVAATVWIGSHRWGIYSMAAGTTLGFALQLFVANLILRRHGLVLHLNWGWNDARLKRLLSLSWPILIGAASTGTITIIDRTMASSLPAGSISALSYAERINSLALVALGSLQTAVFPFFAEQAGRRNHGHLTTDFRQTVALICFVLAPASLLIVAFNRPLVALVFQRGVFDARATVATGNALIGYVVGLVPVAIGLIAVRLAMAVQHSKLIGVQGALNPVLKISFNLLLIPVLSHAGIAFATSAMYTLTTMFLLWGIANRLHVKVRAAMTIPYLKMGLGLLGMVLCLWAIRRALGSPAPGLLPAVGRMLLGCLMGLAAYGAICMTLRVEEAHLVVVAVRRTYGRLVHVRG